MSKGKKSKVFVVDDHPVVCQGLAALIDHEPDLTICGGAEDVHDALPAITSVKPDIVVVDISLNGASGIELVKTIRAGSSKLPVLIFSVHDERIYAERALRAGANGYIMKQEAADKIISAIRVILGGEIYVSHRIANKVLQQFVRGSGPVEHSPVDGLTDRELQVFQLIGEGHSTRQIAEELNLSVKTVESYQAHIKEKLSLKNARELVQHAIQWSLTGGAGESPTG